MEKLFCLHFALFTLLFKSYVANVKYNGKVTIMNFTLFFIFLYEPKASSADSSEGLGQVCEEQVQ